MQIVCNGEPREIEPETTVADLLAALHVEPKQCAVEVNLELVPRAKHAERRLAAGDRLEIVTLVGGG
ncbi:MAG: sulfur carrier protein ThiS [Planctomycetales bacterium]|jgi:thiamine biosynthesis protein ThiS|nr:sulfur carrier protein ThiS [Planctomycetales bacterium]MBN8626258.1 sulfur carrier protein ThiS [Planctomycetota bacterium]